MFDPIEDYAKSEDAPRKPLSMRMSVTMQTCFGCHREAGVLSLNTYTRRFGPRGIHLPSLFETTTQRADQMSVIAKK